MLVVCFANVADFVGSVLAGCPDFGDSVGSPAGGVAHGDDTRGGSGSNVNIDAIILLCGKFAPSNDDEAQAAARSVGVGL